MPVGPLCRCEAPQSKVPPSRASAPPEPACTSTSIRLRVGWGGVGGRGRGAGGWEGTQPVSAANRAQQAVRSLEPPPSAVIQPFCDLQPRPRLIARVVAAK